MEEMERDIVVFTDDDGNEIELDVIDYFEHDGQEYAVLTEFGGRSGRRGMKTPNRMYTSSSWWSTRRTIPRNSAWRTTS